MGLNTSLNKYYDQQNATLRYIKVTKENVKDEDSDKTLNKVTFVLRLCIVCPPISQQKFANP